MMPSENTKKSAEASENVHTYTSPPSKQSNINLFPAGEDGMREPKLYKPCLWALDAFWKRLKPSKRKELSIASEFRELDMRLPEFDFSRLAIATNQFSSTHDWKWWICYGVQGDCVKAVLHTGRTVAVKRFSSGFFHIFRNTVLSISTLHHRNIIRLLGCCIHENTGMLLYEFTENGSLDTFLFDEQRCRQLQWSVRFKVIIGIAKGVIYLQQETRQRTIHRGLNPSNILLGEEMNPKISGFSLARNPEDDQSDLTTCVAGTMGYIAPEYILTGRISAKLDAYSFGVVVLETMTGKRSIKNRLGGVYTLAPYVSMSDFYEVLSLMCMQGTNN